MMPIFILTNDIMCVCMLVVCQLCFINIMFMRERLTETMILGPILAIRKALVFFYAILISVLNFSP
jgi:hypothetical protein